VWHKIGAYFWTIKYFLKITKKLDKVNNSHEYLAYKSWVIWSQNTKVMAKKQISMQGVKQNSKSVSCNHPIQQCHIKIQWVFFISFIIKQQDQYGIKLNEQCWAFYNMNSAINIDGIMHFLFTICRKEL